MIELYVAVGITLALSPLLLFALVRAWSSPRWAADRVHAGPGMQVPWPHRLRMMSVTSTLSLATVLGTTYFGFAHLFTPAALPAWAIALQAAGILVVYDFLYYFAHRAMHLPWLLRHVHGIHHRARNPSALESLYQHPLELLAGLALLFFSTWAIGPLHVRAFGIAFFAYSMLNIVVHSGLAPRAWWWRPLSFLVRKHHVHHLDDPKKNYATLTPLPDLLFGTAA